MDDRQKNRPGLRRKLIQLYAGLLFNAHLKGLVTGKIYQGPLKAICVPGLNCYSCPAAVGACPLGALQNSLASMGHRAGWYALGVVMLMGLTLGRTVCGWLCPFGLIQELMHALPTPKLRKNRVTRALTYLKYVILAVFVVALPLWYGLRYALSSPAFCKYICPAGTLQGAMGLLAPPDNAGLFSMLGGLFTGKFVIMLAVLLACVFIYRAFCRFLCPLGALLGLFSRLTVTGVRADPGKCVGCGACVRACEMDVRRVGDRECIACGACIGACHYGALSLKCGQAVLDDGSAPTPRRRRVHRVIGAAALAALIGFALWVNAPGDSRVAGTAPDPVTDALGVQTGFEVGQRVADFTVTCLDGSTFTLSEQRGKVTVINLWATYCAPCVGEMPLFGALRDAHPDQVSLLAIHAGLVTEDVAAFVRARGWDMPFAVDTPENELFSKLGGSALLPQTIVLDRRGVVIYNSPGSVTGELLEMVFDQAQAGAS